MWFSFYFLPIMGLFMLFIYFINNFNLCYIINYAYFISFYLYIFHRCCFFYFHRYYIINYEPILSSRSRMLFL